MQLDDTVPKILVVDDEPNNLQVLNQILSKQYRLLFAKSGQRAIEFARQQQPQLILLDVMMPEMDGFQTCQILKQDEKTSKIPIIFVTALSEVEDEFRGFELGAVDYITKPISPVIVRARVRTHLSLVSMNELQETRMQIIQRLGRAAEYKDNETGLHVIRMSHYSMLLAKAVGMTEYEQNLLLNASPMHDIGKIGTPDRILLKPGKLDPDEWDIMQTHAQIGADIIGQHDSPLLTMARIIALTHHEKWDGSGYPNHLAGKDIDLVGRIVAVADVFDALTTVRPYKHAWSVDEALKHMISCSGSHFDPNLIDLFTQIMPDILAIKHKWAEQ
ncbi:HD domain-containing phosphohydrolase [Paraglaciecola sp.]|uniref:response regulator n=1 Tax=Paraglaciecola sp. TaxID=1920173 RepID=UPI0030F3D9D4